MSREARVLALVTCSALPSTRALNFIPCSRQSSPVRAGRLKATGHTPPAETHWCLLQHRCQKVLGLHSRAGGASGTDMPSATRCDRCPSPHLLHGLLCSLITLQPVLHPPMLLHLLQLLVYVMCTAILQRRIPVFSGVVAYSLHSWPAFMAMRQESAWMDLGKFMGQAARDVAHAQQQGC